MTINKSCLIGVGLRPTHYSYLRRKPQTCLKWFEAISENYMDSQGRPLAILEFMRQDYPIALHGVSMNIGSVEGLRREYLKNLKSLINRIEPIVVSDHCCWTGAHGANLHDLIPLPFTEECLRWVSSRVDLVQTALGRPIALENVSSYLNYKESEMTEWEFLTRLARKSGCKILLDVNNVYVNAVNHHFSAEEYIASIPEELIAQVHLAGFSDYGDYLFDTHSTAVAKSVWKLFERLTKRLLPNTPLLIEWDEHIPSFKRLEREALKAVSIWNKTHATSTKKTNPPSTFVC